VILRIRELFEVRSFQHREVCIVATFVIPTQTEKVSEASRPCVARIDSWRINVPNESWVIDRILQDVGEGRGGTVFTINLDHLSKLRSDADFRAAYERASYVTADGMPVVMLARAEGVPIERVTGADLVIPLAAAAADAAVPVFFFGTGDEVLVRAIERMREKIPNLVVAGYEAPPMGFDPTGNAARDAAVRIAASGAKICFVALGAPKQEIFANTAVGVADGVVYLGIGAALDFIAGHSARAPRFMQRWGLEWMWRAGQEPRRMVPRYLRSAAWLAGYLVRGLFGMTRDLPEPPIEVVVEPRRRNEDVPVRFPMNPHEVGR
jgi:exopolysaccharide biosynthesis WecB/TagA/CpsF family protein